MRYMTFSVIIVFATISGGLSQILPQNDTNNFDGQKSRVAAELQLDNRANPSSSIDELISKGDYLDTASIIRLRGFAAEQHYVSPATGYNLSLIKLVNPLLDPHPVQLVGSTGRRRQSEQHVEPILFIHGIFESGKSFLMNSNGARPKNYAFLNVRLLRENGLRNLLRNDPSSSSLPFLLSNFGFDVWILSRRAAMESQRLSDKKPLETFNLMQAIQGAISKLVSAISIRINQFNPLTFIGSPASNGQQTSTMDNYLDNLRAQFETHANNNLTQASNYDDLIRQIVYDGRNADSDTYNQRDDKLMVGGGTTHSDYWNFSLDEQARYDLPKVIDYILAKSNRVRLSIVGHSLGAALPIMTLNERPEYGRKISKQILLAPAFHLGASFANNPLVQLIGSLEPILISYLGPISPSFIMPLIQTIVAGPCQLGLLRHETLCLSVLDALFGFSSKQLNKLTDNGQLVNKLMDMSGSNEIVQLMQSMKRGQMHHFDYGSEQKNMLNYGANLQPPPYNVSAINGKTRFSIWFGNKDPLVTQHDTELLIKQLHRVQVERNYVDWPGIHFNHVAFLLHKNVSTLVNIPTLVTLSSR